MKLTNADCIKIYNGLKSIVQPPFDLIRDLPNREDYIFHVRFLTDISLNKRKLEDIVNSLEDGNKNAPEIDEYLKEKEECLVKHSKKDKDGNPIQSTITVDGITQRSYNVPGLADKDSIASKEMDAIEKKYKDILDQRKKQTEQYNEKLKEESHFVPTKIKYNIIPRGLSAQAMDAIILILEDEEVIEPEKPKKAKK
jgi:hypothetical protein